MQYKLADFREEARSRIQNTRFAKDGSAMKIQCQSCQAKYTIADEKVLGKIVKIRCKKCSATIVIIPEYKQPRRDVLDAGIRLFTVHVRRPYPDVLDPKLNTHSKLNDITACIQAYTAGADEALMLDPHGFVATCNSTHFFIVRRGELWTSTGAFCLGGITRGAIGRDHAWIVSAAADDERTLRVVRRLRTREARILDG